MDERIKLAISACLLGERVRWDGTHKLEYFILETLGQWVQFVPLCPEVECGLSVPRDPMRLTGKPAAPRLVAVNSGTDHTGRMNAWAAMRLEQLEQEDLDGFIFKGKSPSCGVWRAKIYNTGRRFVGYGAGIFTRRFMERFPLLPVEDNDRLRGYGGLEDFIEQVFVMRRWRSLLSGQRSPGALAEFHARHKLLISSHNILVRRSLDKLVAAGENLKTGELYTRYLKGLMEALARRTSTKKNVQVLWHILGCLRFELSRDEKQEARELIFSYEGGRLPLAAPLILFNHFVRKYDESYLGKQYYLNPHPLELKLRTHV